jgi:imidazolonepropionase-like amidohydrolase
VAREEYLMATNGVHEFDLAVNNVFVFDGCNKLLTAVSIGVRNGVIGRISHEALQGRQTMDAGGCWLAPGLIDCHVHLFDAAHATDPETMGQHVRLELPKNLQSFLDHGITTVKSVGDPVPELLATRARLATGQLVGPHLLMTGVGITAPDGHPSMTVYGRNPWYRKRATGEVDTIEAARSVVAEMAELGMDAIKLLLQGSCRCCGEPVYKWHGQVPILRLKSKVFEAAVDEAHKYGLKATVHTYEQDRAIEALEAGADGVEHGIVGEVISDERFIELLLRNNASYVPTLWVYPVPQAMQNLATVSQAGVRVALGSDSFAPTIKIEGFDSGNFGANSIVEAERMQAAGLSAIDVLRAATSQAAVHLQRHDIGAIDEGKCADMVLFKKDPTETVQHWRNPLAVISQGRLVVNRTNA